MKVLVTFGCSWTYGRGVAYNSSMTNAEYQAVAGDDSVESERDSFRGILSRRFNMTNINFSFAGSSNHAQFRLAENFLSSDKFKNYLRSADTMIVLWGITSVYRSEQYFLESNQRGSVIYKDESPLSKIIFRDHFDKQHEIELLAQKICFWDSIFDLYGIKNIWFDTFNHHNYATTTPKAVKRMVGGESSHRDLLSRLAINNGLKLLDDNYHLSQCNNDSNRIEYLVKCGLLNPYSYHPTKEAHLQIADIMSKYIE